MFPTNLPTRTHPSSIEDISQLFLQPRCSQSPEGIQASRYQIQPVVVRIHRRHDRYMDGNQNQAYNTHSFFLLLLPSLIFLRIPSCWKIFV
ncbi:hypothetical protein TC41_0676 [Alicyclobacillus acidocaldarius subsp. acidocaldarius Tc-4-1]|uniref:Uncharacterized protein n=1 Tax=Alicyclobacillus acidocaldarius (strain Tc-4-1) TaxID=1048834 RepID=F8IDY0_ALIAT|nr:hypothetical protein TC41_0676 [Alicyclobacillus acidocaldarius subsp. acidocaldarius Tc-4-1]